MNFLAITIGISGSGKNHMINQLKEKIDIKVVEPDDIRRQKLGDVSNQENGAMIFAVAKSMINKNIQDGKNVIFNATNLDWKRNLQFILDLDKEPEIPVFFIFMTDSANLNLCIHRVKKDLENNVDRSKVPEDVIQKQHDRYLKCYQNAASNPDISLEKCPENWKLFLYHNKIKELIYFIEENTNGSIK